MKYLKYLISIILIINILIILSIFLGNSSKMITCTVTRVIDGDTIVVQLFDKNITVRLIGVDTPESVKPNTPIMYYALEASAFTKQQLLSKTVQIEYDVEEKDKYNRTLAYIYLNGKNFNITLAENGYAREEVIQPNTRYSEKIHEATLLAKYNKIGVWKKYDAAFAKGS